MIIKRLPKENERLRVQCNNLDVKIVLFESTTNNLEQYGKMNIVISGIPDNVSSNDLKNTINSLQ